MFVGVTAPLLLVLMLAVFLFAHGGDNDSLTPEPPRSDIASACSGANSAGCPTSVSALAPTGVVVRTATPVPPTPTPGPRSYTVEAGDTLSLICAAEVAEMAIDACIAAVVRLSDLDGPDDIVEGQTLRLPPKAGSTPTSSTRPASSATATRTPQPQAGAPDVVFEPEPEDDDASDEVNESSADAAEADESKPAASLVALGPDGQPPTPTATATATPSPTPSPVPTLPPGFRREDATLYTVKPGDNLLSICAEQVPQYSVPDCVYLVVQLNDLQAPDEVYAYQGLLLP
jgi:nucleoid-associated protein YgaU